MTKTEMMNHEYKEVCKRCYKFEKENVRIEVPDRLVDYYKGPAIIVMEEFVLTLQ